MAPVEREWLVSSKGALSAIFLTLCVASPASADTIRVQLGAGYDFSSGRYGGTKSTDTQTISFNGRAVDGNWRLRLYVPFLNIHGPAGDVVIGGTPHALPSTVRRGLGDTALTLTYTIDDPDIAPLYGVIGGSVRLPTGSYAHGLGVGATDFGLQSEVGTQFDSWGVYLDIAGRLRGNHDKTGKRRNGLLASTGFWFNADDDWQLGAYYAWSQRVTRVLVDQQDLGALVRYKITPSLSVQLYGGIGMSRSSSSKDGGVRLSYWL